MATLPRAAIDAYTESLNMLSSAARETVAAMLEQVDYSDIADLREQVIEIMEAVCGASADLAAARAAEFYDEARAIQAGVAIGAVAYAGREPASTAGAVRALVQRVVDGKPWDSFVAGLQDRADYEVKRAAGECVKANAAKDPLKPKWARVPSGAETCRFCLMLASRGFVYVSADTAGEGGHYHPSCDCRIVPGFPGMDVEGYDPDALYRQWKELEREDRIRRSVKAEDGAAPLPKEQEVGEMLADDLGWRVEFVRPVNKNRVKTADALVNGELWEFKIPEAWNDKTVKNQFKRALGKGTPCLLISGTRNGATVQDMEPFVAAIFEGGEFSEIDTVMLVDGKHGVKVMKRKNQDDRQSHQS